jgi:ABC-2 type transport system permease protein
MQQKYNQFKGMMAIVKASFKAQLKSPMALVFGFIFPLFFILIFGGGNSEVPKTNIAFDKNSNKENFFYGFVDTTNHFKTHYNIINDSLSRDSLLRGKISAIYNIEKLDDKNFVIKITPSKATENNSNFLKLMTQAMLFNIQANAKQFGFEQNYTVKIEPSIGNRVYKRIDKVLPGQLGFSLLSAGLFGVAFLFFNLRETLVLKRLNATPIKKTFILLGEGLARIFFQMIIICTIIAIGYFFFGFSLVNGFQTFISLLILSFIGLLVFMGFGFIISGAAKSINTIPALTNLLGFPQFMLSGTFFPYEGLPSFLHPVCKILPLTHLNDAMYKVSFEGLPLLATLPQIGILFVWVIVLYTIAFKVFKWE